MDAHVGVKVRGMSNHLVGVLILTSALTFFTLHTIWGIVMPFLPDDSGFQTYMPARVWAIHLPSLVLVIGLSTVGLFIGTLLRTEALRISKT